MRVWESSFFIGSLHHTLGLANIICASDLGEHVGGLRYRESGRVHSEIREEGAEAAEIPQLIALSEPQYLRGAVSPAAAQR